MSEEGTDLSVLESALLRIQEYVPFMEGSNEHTAFVWSILITFFLLSIILSVFVFECPRPYCYANFVGWVMASLAALGWAFFVEAFLTGVLESTILLNCLFFGGTLLVFVLFGGALARRLFGQSYQDSCTLLLANLLCTGILGILIYYATLAFSSQGYKGQVALSPEFQKVFEMLHTLEDSKDVTIAEKLDRINAMNPSPRTDMHNPALVAPRELLPTTDYDLPIILSNSRGLRFCIPPDFAHTYQANTLSAAYQSLNGSSLVKPDAQAQSRELQELIRLYQKLEHPDALSDEEKLEYIQLLSERLRTNAQ